MEFVPFPFHLWLFFNGFLLLLYWIFEDVFFGFLSGSIFEFLLLDGEQDKALIILHLKFECSLKNPLPFQLDKFLSTFSFDYEISRSNIAAILVFIKNDICDGVVKLGIVGFKEFVLACPRG